MNGICVPREPRREEAQFYQSGGYTIFVDHARDDFMIASWGTMGYDIPNMLQWTGLTEQDYANACEVHYAHDDYKDSKFVKLRKIEVSFCGLLITIVRGCCTIV